VSILKTIRLLGIWFSMTIAIPVVAHSENNIGERQYPAIVVIEAKLGSLTDKIVSTGTIDAVEEVYVQPQVDGLAINSLSADVGDTVKAGQVLATIDDNSLKLDKLQLVASQAKAEASLAQYKIQLRDSDTNEVEAKRQLARGKTLADGGSMSTSELQKLETSATNASNSVANAEQSIAIAEAELKSVNSQIADVDLKLARTDIKAPYGGIVTARTARVGAIAAGSGSPLFTILRDGQLELVADVSEDDILKTHIGQLANINIAGLGKPIEGKIRLVSPVVNATSRLGTVHIALSDSTLAKQGMYASAVITIAKGDGIVLPLSAIEAKTSGSITRVVRDNVVHQISIETSIVENGQVLVTKGVKPGDLVVSKAGAFVRNGDQIRPVHETDAVSN
jgi:HlyD family secretion protein